jgi:hypothetical protein
MSPERPRYVTLTGDLAGDYVVVEERADGSLVVAPDASGRPRAPSPQPSPSPSAGPSLFSGLFARPPRTPPDVPTILEGWGVELGEEEAISDFILAEIDGSTGFLAITSQRFIFATHTGRTVTVVQEHLLSSARNVEVFGRRRRQKLRVSWHGVECVVSALDQDALSRLHQHLTARAAG